MSYYDNPQWAGPSQNNWEHQSGGATTPVRAGANGPQPQDEWAFSYQFDEVDRAHENLQKSGKGFAMGGRRRFSPMPHAPGSARRTPDFDGRMPHGPGPRSHSLNSFDDARSSQGSNLHNFYTSQRHQSSRGSNEAEQVMQAKRRMAAQRERELRNLHTEQQFQRSALPEAAPPPSNKQMSEEETRDLIARQRSALYGEGTFAEKSGYIDENGNVRAGAPGPSGPPSLRGASPLTFDAAMGRGPPTGDSATPGSANEQSGPTDLSPRPQSTSNSQSTGPPNKVFDNAVGPQSRTTTSSPTGGSPPRDLAPGSKGPSVAPIGTRPSGTPSNGSSAKRSTTPMASSGNWPRGNGVWGQSGLGAQASVWG